MKRLAQDWTDYAVQVLPETCPKVQRQETRRAFYAGAHALFQQLMGVLDDDHEPTEGDLRRVGELDAEIKAFYEDVKRGRA